MFARFLFLAIITIGLISCDVNIRSRESKPINPKVSIHKTADASYRSVSFHKPGKLSNESLRPPTDALRMPSGASYIVLKSATLDEMPRDHDKVQVHYSLWNAQGDYIGSTRKKNSPIALAPYRLLDAWAEALLSMSIGESRRFWWPDETAKKLSARVPSGILIMDVELVDVNRRPEPPGRPEQLNKPIADANRTTSGIYYKKTQLGLNGRKPDFSDRVVIKYSVWNGEGRLLKSTWLSNRSESIRLKSVKVKAWREAIALLSEGDAANFWIPKALLGEEKGKEEIGEAVYLVLEKVI